MTPVPERREGQLLGRVFTDRLTGDQGDAYLAHAVDPVRLTIELDSQECEKLPNHTRN